ncbi:NUDIX domain-containing protein [Candidatus Uhrbacteria bacterium]|nr:NUDIX domain-containing protein [Candidatus Uhrbacteria bacterium]
MPAILPPNCTEVYKGFMFNIFQCPMRQFDDSTKTFEYMVRQDSVTIIAFLDPETIILTEQKQPGRPDPFIDFPGGRVDEGETHEQAALREFKEETGYRIGRIMPLWNMHLMGSTRFEKTFYIATDLKKISDSKLDGGENIRVFSESLVDVSKRCAKYELRQLGGMLCILNIIHDPETNQKIMSWLKT